MPTPGYRRCADRPAGRGVRVRRRPAHAAVAPPDGELGLDLDLEAALYALASTASKA